MWIFSSPACPIHTFSTVERLQLRCAGVQLKINIVTLSRIVTRARKLQTKLIDRPLLSRHCTLFLSCHRKLLLRTAIRLHGAVLQENVVQRESKRLQRLLPDPLLQLTLPKGDAMPAHGSQLMLHPFISRPVALKFSETLYVRTHPYT